MVDSFLYKISFNAEIKNIKFKNFKATIFDIEKTLLGL
jgi:hypothetical protein